MKHRSISSLTWERLHGDFGRDFPNFFHLIDYLFTLSGSSVDAETGFSCMKLVKNDWRSRLGDANLSVLLLTPLEVDSIDKFNPMPAIESWYDGGERARIPFYLDELKRSCVPTEKVIVSRKGDLEAEEEDDEVQNKVAVRPVSECYCDEDDDDIELETEYSRNGLVELQKKSYNALLMEMNDENDSNSDAE